MTAIPGQANPGNGSYLIEFKDYIANRDLARKLKFTITQIEGFVLPNPVIPLQTGIQWVAN